MTKAEPTDAGCWVDGHWGQYAVARMVELAADHGYDDGEVVGLARRHLASAGPSVAPDLSDDEHEQLSWAADEVEAWMNEHVAPAGFYFEWSEGEFFLSPSITPGVCKDCGDDGDACGDDDEHSRHCWWIVHHDDGREQVA